MATTLVGVFDDHSDAQQACDKLFAAGFDREAVQITSGNAATMGDPSAISTSTGKREHQGGIRGFFASLFGDDDVTSGHYSEAVRRGNAVVTVNLPDDRRVDEVTDILEDCRAADVDERIEHWKTTGYSGYDPSAPPFSSEEIAREREQMRAIPEDLKISKREVQGGGVRVHRRMTETPIEEQVTLRDERAAVERQKVDRPVSAADLDDTEVVRDTVRRSDVDVEQFGEGVASKGATLSRPHTRPSSMPPYGGPERRQNSGAYAGTDRRAGF